MTGGMGILLIQLYEQKRSKFTSLGHELAEEIGREAIGFSLVRC